MRPPSDPYTLDAAFAALADPTRRAIVQRLAAGDATVLELAEPFEISLPAISRHLKVLERAGLISRGRDAQKRPCRLEPEGLAAVSRWAEHTRAAWQARFDRLGEYLGDLQAQPGTKRAPESEHAQERGGGRQQHPSREQRAAGIGFGAVELGLQTLDKLGAYAAELAKP